MNNTWEIDADYKGQIDDKLANFIIEHAITSLNHTIETSDKTTNRVYTLLVVMIPLTSTVIGFIVNEANKKPSGNTTLIYFFTAVTLICLLIWGLLFKLLFPRLTMASGREPKDMVQPSMFKPEYKSVARLKAFKLNEIKNLQYKIDYNNRQNLSRIKLFKSILAILFFIFLSGIIFYFTIVFQSAPL